MDLAIFKYQEKQVRAVQINSELHFVAKDVFEALDISWRRSDSLATISDKMKTQLFLGDGVNDPHDLQQGTWLLNEAGVYKVAFRSSKPEAEKFTDWIATDVLPSIRKEGGYISPNSSLAQLDKLQETITTLLVNQQKQLDALAIEQKKLFKSGETNPGCYSVVVAGMEESYEDDGYVTADEWLRAKGINLDTTQLNTFRKRASSFLRIGKNVEPTKIGNRVVYAPSQYCYLEQALVSTLGLTI